ncbi:MAG TPA: aspartate 1-decarboxylase, partial [Gammaproteobacteria bacterium]|nr:aspartate 1-decarboxylase [Gammaproteobacteria bacterium]
IQEYEQIEIYNVSNGERFTTYAIRAEDGSGIISVNGAAAHRADPGDIIIICAYVGLTQQELASFKPKLVYLDEQNHITHTRNTIPVQVA